MEAKTNQQNQQNKKYEELNVIEKKAMVETYSFMEMIDDQDKGDLKPSLQFFYYDYRKEKLNNLKMHGLTRIMCIINAAFILYTIVKG